MSLPEEMWRQTILPINSSIGQAISNLNQSKIKVILVVNQAGMFEGTISDGDIRRGLLAGLNLNSPIVSIVHKNSLTVSSNISREQIINLMLVNKVQQIPVIDEHNSIIGLYLLDEIIIPLARQNLMVIMAGGRGTRLYPYTEHCPKPLLKVANKPILEHIIDRAKSEGFSRFVIAIHYLGHMIEAYFGNGKDIGVEIDYVHEGSPLGTAGALSLLKLLPDIPFVVTNGDVITDIRYGELLDFHIQYKANATMAVRTHEWENPFGVVQTKGLEIIGFEEKPIFRSHINAGVYVLDSSVLKNLKPNAHCDMPKLFERLRANGKKIIAYSMYEPWLDVGRPEDLAIARLN